MTATKDGTVYATDNLTEEAIDGGVIDTVGTAG
jgi:hypothetical protein